MPTEEKLKVLVTGATGKQGGALSRALLRKGYDVRALTRRPDSEAALELAASGAEIFSGDFDDPLSVEKAARGADAAFVMSTPYEAGTEVETRQGIAAVDAVAGAGTGHIIYASVASADAGTGIPHFDSKYEVEKHLVKLGVPYTIVGPVYFMENLFLPSTLEGLKKGTYAVPMPPDRKLQQVAVEDVGNFNAFILENLSRFRNRRIDIASDEVSGRETAELLSSLNGHHVSFFRVPIDDVRKQSEDWAIMYEWFDRVGYKAEIPTLKRAYPEVDWHTYDRWAREQDWPFLG